MLKRAGAVVITLAMFVGAFAYVNGVLTEEYPEGSLNLDEYQQCTVVPDVLLLGSSTMATNIEIVDLWNDYGIAAHSLGGASASMHDNYYRLLAAEETAVPDMVILDVKAVTHWTEFATEEGRIKNITGVDLSVNKLNYLNAALPMAQRLDYLMNIPLFHTRYASLGLYDFEHTSVYGADDKGNWSIFYGNLHAPTLTDGNEITEYRAIHEKPEYYLRKIIAHCQEKGIELILIKTPDAARAKNQPYYNTVALLAQECQVPFLDMNRMDAQTGLVSTDFYHDNDHLNVIGARKCTKVLGEYLEENYELPDRRGDEAYSSWVRYAALKDMLYMMQITNKEEYFAELARNGKQLIVVPLEKNGESSPEYAALKEKMDALGYELLDSGELVLGRVTLTGVKQGKSVAVHVKDMNGTNQYSISSPGCILVIYDEVLDEIADIVSFVEKDGCALHRLYAAR